MRWPDWLMGLVFGGLPLIGGFVMCFVVFLRQ